MTATIAMISTTTRRQRRRRRHLQEHHHHRHHHHHHHHQATTSTNNNKRNWSVCCVALVVKPNCTCTYFCMRTMLFLFSYENSVIFIFNPPERTQNKQTKLNFKRRKEGKNSSLSFCIFCTFVLLMLTRLFQNPLCLCALASPWWMGDTCTWSYA